jgi:hypothetical protein
VDDLGRPLTGILSSEYYQQLGTPARQRDYLQRYVFPALKRAALGEARATIGEDQYQGATVTGENARRKQRQAKLLEALEAGEPQSPQEQEDLIGTPPPAGPTTDVAPGLGGPPPGP